MKYILHLANISENDFVKIGGKAASISVLVQHGIEVPAGFVLTNEAFEDFKSTELPAELVKEIFTAFDSLNTDEVAVRSSANGEDSKAVSWAGQFTTHLEVTKDRLIESILSCWQSAQSQHVASYAQKTDSSTPIQMAVIIQTMIPSEVAGVIFTKNPITQNGDEMLIDAIYGLGESLAQGEVTPNSYIYNSATHTFIQTSSGDQAVEQNSTQSGGDNAMLRDAQLEELVIVAKNIEQIFGAPQDIEWAYAQGKLYILQARPITT